MRLREKGHRITILKQIPIPTLNFWPWRRVCQCWAEIHNDMITIRYKKDLLPGMHIVAGADRYEITAVIDRPGKTRLVELHTREIRASADMSDAQQR